MLQFVYDESGAPYALRYSADGGSSWRTFYYILNLQGDVVELVYADKTVCAIYTYNAWGQVTSAETTAPNITANLAELNPLRYRGYYYDTETGFYYLQSRYYDPVVKRFLNADTYTSTNQGFLGYNMFAYCENNPISNTDPNGELTLGLAALGALIGGATSVAVTIVASGGSASCGEIAGAFVGGAIGGLLTFSSAGRVAVAALSSVGGIAGYLTECAVNKEKVTLAGVGNAAVSGLVSGMIAGDGVFKNEAVMEHSVVYDILKYNLSGKKQADLFFNAAAGLQRALPDAIKNSLKTGVFGSIVGTITNKFLDMIS